MDRSEAVNLARMEVIGTFKVLSVEGMSKEQEESLEIRLIQPGEVYIPSEEEASEEAEVYYVTLGFDSVQGDGTFTVTCRVTDPMGDELPVRIADYLAMG